MTFVHSLRVCVNSCQRSLFADNVQHGAVSRHATSGRNGAFWCCNSCFTPRVDFALQLSAAPAYVQKLHSIRSEMDATRSQVPFLTPPTRAALQALFGFTSARQLFAFVNMKRSLQVEILKKRAHALKVVKQVCTR